MVNREINDLAAKMGGTSEDEKAERAQNARTAEAGTDTWRNITFTGRMVSEMGEDLFHQRELGIEANNMVIAARHYLKREDLTPGQRHAAEQYLARAIGARGNAAEAILQDSAVVLSGTAADVGTLGAGGMISRGAARVFGSAEATAASQAGQAVARTEATAATRAAEGKLADRFQELATLTHLLRQQENHTDEVKKHLDWVLALHQRTASQPKWWSLMPQSWRVRRERRKLQLAGLFNADAYLERYPDVAAAGLDPLDHYLRHGIYEDRVRIF